MDHTPPFDMAPTDDVDHALANKVLSAYRERLHAIDWFACLSEPVNSQDRGFAYDYLDGLGFNDCMVHYIHSWQEAEDAAQGIDAEAPWWIEENRRFEEALQEAAAKLGEETVSRAMQAIAGEMNMLVPQELTDYAREGGYMDDALVQAAFGMAVRHAQMACAMLLAGSFDERHPFTQLINIYEIGHWPIGIVGRSFIIF